MVEKRKRREKLDVRGNSRVPLFLSSAWVAENQGIHESSDIGKSALMFRTQMICATVARSLLPTWEMVYSIRVCSTDSVSNCTLCRSMRAMCTTTIYEFVPR